MKGIQINNYFNNHIMLNGKKINQESQPVLQNAKKQHFNHNLQEVDSCTFSFIQKLWREEFLPARAASCLPKKGTILSMRSKREVDLSVPFLLNAKKTHTVQRKKNK